MIFLNVSCMFSPIGGELHLGEYVHCASAYTVCSHCRWRFVFCVWTSGLTVLQILDVTCS